jgi:hypothetical protein
MSFEAHITIDPVEGKYLEQVSKLAREHGFGTGDEPLYSVRQARNQGFITGHHWNYDEMFGRVATLCRALLDAGYPVRRYKIEHVRIDSKHLDVFNILEK